MPTPKKGPRLGGSPAHQKAILANLATSLFEHGAITTTEAKARVLRPYAERLITKAKRGDLHNRRQVMAVIRDKSVVHVLFTEIGPRFAERPGGYTRITKIGPRKGDNAPMAVIALVEAAFTAKTRSATPAVAAVPVAGAPTETAATAADVEPGDAEPQPPVSDVATTAQEPGGAHAATAEPSDDGAADDSREDVGESDASAEPAEAGTQDDDPK